MFESAYRGLPVFLTLLIAGCAAATKDPVYRDAAKPAIARMDPRPSERADEKLPGQQEPSARPEPLGVITLDVALMIALARNPKLAEVSWESRAAEGSLLQAGLRPNPEVEVAVEEFAGSSGRKSFRSAETTLQVSQLFELAGKRSKRTRVAELTRDLAGWDFHSARLDVYTETAKAFVKVLAAQRQAALKADLLALADQVFDTARERVGAGRASPVEGTKAKIQLEISRIEAGRAQRHLEAARIHLASTWGSNSPAFERVEGEFDQIPRLPDLEGLKESLAENPDIARPRSELARRRAALVLERARDTPDVTITAGVKRFEETDDQAFVAGLSVPLPIFGVNPGGVLEAERKLAQGRDAERAVVVRVTAALEQAYQEATALYAELATLTEEVLPGARRAFDVARQGYREGKFGFLEVLDAQRTLFETRERYIESVAAYRSVLFDLGRYTGQLTMTPTDGGANPRGNPR